MQTQANKQIADLFSERRFPACFLKRKITKNKNIPDHVKDSIKKTRHMPRKWNARALKMRASSKWGPKSGCLGTLRARSKIQRAPAPLPLLRDEPKTSSVYVYIFKDEIRISSFFLSQSEFPSDCRHFRRILCLLNCAWWENSAKKCEGKPRYLV